jgi:hypothetical protein
MPNITRLEDIIKTEVIPFAEQANFKIETWDDFITELKSHLQCSITNSAYYGDEVEVHGAHAALFGLDTPIVHISDVIKWLNGNDASSYVFKYCISKSFPKFLKFRPTKEEVFVELTNRFLPSTQHSMSVCIDGNMLKKKVNEKLLKTIKFHCRVAGLDVTVNEIRKKLMTGYAKTKSGLITKKTTKTAVVSCIKTFKNLKNWTVYNGYAGTGKTYQAVKSIKKNERVLCIALSNTVTLQLKQRLLNNGINQSDIVVCPYAGLHKVNVNEFDVIVIDEISQSGLKEYRAFNEIFKQAPNARYIFMGDVHQIKSFISGGSLLNTLVEEFKGTKHIVNLTKVMRSTNAKLNNSVINFAKTGDIKPFIVSGPNIADYDIIVTGANINVARLNNEYVQKKFNQKSALGAINSNSIKFDVQDYDTDTNQMLYKAMAKGNTINLIGKGKTINKVKIMTNEPWTAKLNPVSKDIIAVSKIDGRTVELPKSAFIGGQFFAPGYAINVNRAQGLEWDKVLVMANMLRNNGTLDRNLYESHEAMYVALSRGKQLTHLCINGDLKSKCQKYIRANNYAEVQ